MILFLFISLDFSIIIVLLKFFDVLAGSLAAKEKNALFASRHSKNHRPARWSFSVRNPRKFATCWTTHRHVCSNLLSGWTVFPSLFLFFDAPPLWKSTLSRHYPKLGILRYLTGPPTTRRITQVAPLWWDPLRQAPCPTPLPSSAKLLKDRFCLPVSQGITCSDCR